MMRANSFIKLLLLTAFTTLGSTAFGSSDVAIHPVPKKPVFLSESIYESIRSDLPALPLIKSAAQTADETELKNYQTTRTAAQCAQAKEEVYISLESFFGAKHKILSAEEVKHYTALFEQIRNDADYFIQKLKVDYPRKRPFLYITGLSPCIPKEVTGAYPSGHAVLANLYALVLSDLKPTHKEAIMSRAQEISRNRVLAGVHHPSDITAGATVAKTIYKALKNSPRYSGSLSAL